MSNTEFLVCIAIYCGLFFALYVWQMIRDRRIQRKADLARVDSICRHWKSMDQPRDKKTGRYMRKVKA